MATSQSPEILRVVQECRIKSDCCLSEDNLMTLGGLWYIKIWLSHLITWNFLNYGKSLCRLSKNTKKQRNQEVWMRNFSFSEKDGWRQDEPQTRLVAQPKFEADWNKHMDPWEYKSSSIPKSKCCFVSARRCCWRLTHILWPSLLTLSLFSLFIALLAIFICLSFRNRDRLENPE